MRMMATHQAHRKRNSLKYSKNQFDRPYSEEEEAAALMIQRCFRHNRAKGWSVWLLRKAIHIGKRRMVMRARIREVLLYAIFLFFFTAATISDFHDQDAFHFQNNVRGQFTRVEFLEEDSPSWGKTFTDVATVQEYYQWLRGPFLQAAFSPSTFDGDADWGSMTPGNILGYGRVVGGVRVGQLRVRRQDCAHRLSGAWRFSNSTVYCYGTEQGEWDEGLESTADFGKGPHKFTYDGWNQTLTPSVAEERATGFSYERTLFMNVYPAPAFSVMLPHEGLAEAEGLVQSLIDGRYVDLHTKAVFIDLTVYNVMLDRYLAIRMIMEVTKSGGVLPSYDAKLVPPTPFPFSATASVGKMLSASVVIGFYCYYITLEYYALRRSGLNYFRSMETWFHDLNLFFYVIVWALRLAAYSAAPGDIVLDGDAFVAVKPYAELYTFSRYVNACNAFLCWFKIIKYLSLAPQFALVTGTLAESAAEVSGFLIIFIIITYGFATAFMMTFGSQLSGYRNMTMTLCSLIKSLLGEFDFDDLQTAQWVMGPLLFVVFVALAVFIILNLLIAIISDAYGSVKVKLEMQENISLGSEIKDYVIFRINQTPVVGSLWRRMDQRRQDLQLKLQNQLAAAVPRQGRRMSELAKVRADIESGPASASDPSAASPAEDPAGRRLTAAQQQGLGGAAVNSAVAGARQKKIEKLVLQINSSTGNLLQRLEEIQYAVESMQQQARNGSSFMSNGSPGLGGSPARADTESRRSSNESLQRIDTGDEALFSIYQNSSADSTPRSPEGKKPETSASASASAAPPAKPKSPKPRPPAAKPSVTSAMPALIVGGPSSSLPKRSRSPGV